MVTLEVKTAQQCISSDNVLTQYLALRLPPHSTCWALYSQNSWTAMPTESPKGLSQILEILKRNKLLQTILFLFFWEPSFKRSILPCHYNT